MILISIGKDLTLLLSLQGIVRIYDIPNSTFESSDEDGDDEDEDDDDDDEKGIV